MAFRIVFSLAASAAAGGVLALGAVLPVKAELVFNGGFSNNSIAGSYGSSLINGGQGVSIADWAVSTSYSFLVADGGWATANFNDSNNGPDPVWGTPIVGYNGSPLGLYSTGQSVSAPTGSGWFVISNGAYGADARFSQTVSGFTPGQEYTLSYYYAGGQQQGYDGDATSWWKVKLGAMSFDSPVINITSKGAVSPWVQYSAPFTAPGTDLVLEFLADGAPSAQMPFALLAGVSITESTPPPPPSVPGPLPAVGVGMGLAWSRQLRRRIAVAATR